VVRRRLRTPIRLRSVEAGQGRLGADTILAVENQAGKGPSGVNAWLTKVYVEDA